MTRHKTAQPGRPDSRNEHAHRCEHQGSTRESGSDTSDAYPAPGERSARFQCVIALAKPYGATYTAAGMCEGQIGFSPRGEHGFGYDPIFVVDGYGGQTMAELDPEEKNQISHRARAMQAARPLLFRLLAREPILQLGD